MDENGGDPSLDEGEKEPHGLDVQTRDQRDASSSSSTNSLPFEPSEGAARTLGELAVSNELAAYDRRDAVRMFGGSSKDREAHLRIMAAKSPSESR
jgi:hypothetical protein